MQEQMKDFYIERERHYQHHEFIEGMIKWSQSWKSTCMKAIMNAVAIGLLTLLIMGFIAWGGKAFKG